MEIDVVEPVFEKNVDCYCHTCCLQIMLYIRIDETVCFSAVSSANMRYIDRHTINRILKCINDIMQVFVNVLFVVGNSACTSAARYIK